MYLLSNYSDVFKKKTKFLLFSEYYFSLKFNVIFYAENNDWVSSIVEFYSKFLVLWVKELQKATLALANTVLFDGMSVFQNLIIQCFYRYYVDYGLSVF